MLVYVSVYGDSTPKSHLTLIPLYETKKEVPKFAMTVIWDPGISESLIRNCEGTETRHVLGEAKTRWIGTFPKYRVIGELSSLE